MKKTLFLLMFLLCITKNVMSSAYDSVLTDDIRAEISNSFDIIADDFEIDPQELIESLNRGEFKNDNSLWDKIKDTFKTQINENAGFFSKTILLILLAGLIQNINFNPKSKDVINMVCTSVVILSTINVFNEISSYIQQTIDKLILFINSLIPVLTTLTVTSGYAVSTSVLNPIMLGVSSFISLFIKSVILPVLFMGLGLKVTASVTGKEIVADFGKSAFSLVKWVIGITVTVYMGIISIIGITIPNVDGVALKTAKYAVSSFVPYVGGMLSDSVELVMSCAGVVKNSVGIAGLLGILSVVALPCIKISVIILIFNFLALVVTPVTEKATSTAIKDISSGLNIMLGMLLVTALMYIISVTVIILIGGA